MRLGGWSVVSPRALGARRIRRARYQEVTGCNRGQTNRFDPVLSFYDPEDVSADHSAPDLDCEGTCFMFDSTCAERKGFVALLYSATCFVHGTYECRSRARGIATRRSWCFQELTVHGPRVSPGGSAPHELQVVGGPRCSAPSTLGSGSRDEQTTELWRGMCKSRQV